MGNEDVTWVQITPSSATLSSNDLLIFKSQQHLNWYVVIPTLMYRLCVTESAKNFWLDF
jgi:hypothetical protein